MLLARVCKTVFAPLVNFSYNHTSNTVLPVLSNMSNMRYKCNSACMRIGKQSKHDSFKFYPVKEF